MLHLPHSISAGDTLSLLRRQCVEIAGGVDFLRRDEDLGLCAHPEAERGRHGVQDVGELLAGVDPGLPGKPPM